jgi:hypothetical protein
MREGHEAASAAPCKVWPWLCVAAISGAAIAGMVATAVWIGVQFLSRPLFQLPL